MAQDPDKISAQVAQQLTDHRGRGDDYISRRRKEYNLKNWLRNLLPVIVEVAQFVGEPLQSVRG